MPPPLQDSDGKLSTSEVMEGLDEDGDGRLSKAEFEVWWRAPHPVEPQVSVNFQAKITAECAHRHRAACVCFLCAFLAACS